MLMHHDWPGNVRELENCLERAAVMTEGNVIDRDAILLTGIDEKVSMGAAPSRPSTSTTPTWTNASRSSPRWNRPAGCKPRPRACST